MFGRIGSWLRWMVPTRLDGVVTVWGFLVFFALAIPVVSVLYDTKQYTVIHPELLFAPFLGAWFAVAAFFGALNWRGQLSSFGYLVSFLLVPMVLCYGAWASGNWQTQIVLERVRLDQFLIATVFVLFFLVYVESSLLGFLVHKFAPSDVPKSKKRLRMLITLAIGFYVFFLLTNIFDFDAGFLWSRGNLTDVWTLSLLTLLVCLMSSLPGVFIFCQQQKWLMVIFPIAIFVVTSVVAFPLVSARFGSYGGEVCCASYVAAFLVSCFLLWPQYKFVTAGLSRETQLPVPNKPRMGLLGKLLILVAFAALVANYFVEPALMACYLKQGDIGVAIFKLEKTPSESREISLEPLPNGSQQLVFNGVFSKDTKANFFEPLDDVDIVLDLSIWQMQPHVDTSFLKHKKTHVSIRDNCVSTAQLGDLVNASTCYLYQVEILTSEEKSPITEIGDLNFWEATSESAKNLFDAIDEAATVGSVTVTFQQPETDTIEFDSLFSAGRKFPVWVGGYFMFSDELVQLATTQESEFLTLESWMPKFPKGHLEKFWRLALDSKVSCRLQEIPDDLPTKEMSLLIYSASEKVEFPSLPDSWSKLHELLDSNRLSDSCLAYGTEFGNEASVIQRLYLPPDQTLVDKAADVIAPELKVLSLDVAWLHVLQKQFLNGLYRYQDFDCRKLASLKNLEELYLPAEMPIADSSFLKNLTNLRHLQIDSLTGFVGQNNLSVSADLPTNLESITLFHEPNRSFANQLAKLPRLKKVTVVDSLATLEADSESLVLLEKRLGNRIEVEVIAAKGVGELIPQDFKQHAEEVKRNTRKKYLDE